VVTSALFFPSLFWEEKQPIQKPLSLHCSPSYWFNHDSYSSIYHTTFSMFSLFFNSKDTGDTFLQNVHKLLPH
jgi:hypothetical protein